MTGPHAPAEPSNRGAAELVASVEAELVEAELVEAPRSELVELAAELVAGGGLAPTTRDKYRRQLAAFLAWRLDELRLDGRAPVTPAHVVLYLARLVELDRSSASLRLAVAAIGAAHDWTGAVDPTDDGQVRRALREATRRRGVAPDAPRRALGLVELAAMMPPDRGIVERRLEPLDVRDAAILAVGWFGGFRRSELVALDVGDVLSSGWVDVGIRVRRSKRDQAGAGAVVGLPLWAPDGSICPVRRLRAWLDLPDVAADRLDPRAPLFRSVDRWGRIGGRLTPDVVHRIVLDRARAAELAGLDELGAHSLRSGLATECARAGVPIDAIAAHLRHGSRRTTEGYIRLQTALGPDNPLRLLAARLT